MKINTPGLKLFMPVAPVTLLASLFASVLTLTPSPGMTGEEKEILYWVAPMDRDWIR